MNILEHLVKEGILNEKKAAALGLEAKKAGLNEEEIILKEKIVPENFLFKLKSKILEIPLKEIDISKVTSEVFSMIPEEPAINYKMVPLAQKDNFVEIGMVYPESIPAQEALRFLSRQENFSYKIFLITITDFDNLLKKHQSLKIETEKALAVLEKEKDISSLGLEEQVATKEITEEAPIIRMVSVILRHAILGRASDIHIEPIKGKLRVRFRLDGVLYPSLFLPLHLRPAIIARIKILSNLKIDEVRIPQDGRFSAKVAGKDIDFRVSTLPTIYGEKVALRVLDPLEGFKSYTELGLKGRNIKVVEEVLKKPSGLILVTGPTGSGKTTTLYALLRALNKEDLNIVTIEDPVEYSIEGVGQSQVKPEIGYEFARALRHIVRQDPDIIMVGEVRDEETAALVTHAALTGQLVLSTLHTKNAIGAIPRLIDMNVEPFLISSTVSVVISQRLVRVLCPHCRKKIKPESKIRDYILEKVEGLPSVVRTEIKIPKNIYVYSPNGCEECGFKGYTGRSGLFEILKMTDSLAKIISKETLESTIVQEAKNQGMITMEQDGVLKVLEGETTVEEVMRVVQES